MKKVVALCLLLMASIAVSRAAGPSPFKSIRAPHGVPLDTNPGSAFWRGAAPTYLEVDNWGKPVPLHRTEVRSRWTKDNLYLLYICPYQKLNPKPNPHPKTETNELWNWDVAEIFIGSDFKNIRRYKEFEMSPQGEWLDLDINLDLPRHEDGWIWNSGFKVATRIDRQKKIWYGAMRIPFAAIDPKAPKVGTLFRVNMFRMQGPAPDTKSIVWQPTMKATFHVPERFGLLELANSK
jgi:hypothetical protein